MASSLLRAGDGKSTETRTFHVAGMPILAVIFLLLSASIEVVRSHYLLLWADEFGVLLTSSIPGLARLIHIELTKPVSLDAIGYNALMHSVVSLFGTGAFVMRSPSMGGYLLMQICLFYFVRRIATERAATFALAFPALVGIVSYSVQARPYGLLLGMAALVMLAWQTATRRESNRIWALVALSLSLALAINTQYYGVLLLVPLCAAEGTRILDRRRVDVPVLVAIAAGAAGLLIVLPFAKALSPFKVSHVAGNVNLHFITHAYFWLIFGYEQLGVSSQHLIGAGVAVLILALIAAFVSLRSKVTLRLPRAEAVFLFSLAALPVFGYLLAKFVTHVVEARYIQPAIIGIAALLAVLMAPVLQNKVIGRVLLALLLAAIAWTGVLRIQTEKDQGEQTTEALVVSPETQRLLDAFPGQPIYVANPGEFSFIGYYSSSADVRSRISQVYLGDSHYRAGGWGADVAMQIANMQAAGVRNIVPYESVSGPGTGHLFLLNHNPWDWTDEALRASHAQVEILGRYFGGDLAYVRFP